MAGLFGSITIKGNRLTEFASQTSTVGIPIPFGFGKFPCEGNIIFAPMPPKEHVKKKKQGKGGVKTEEYSYTLSYAIAFCEGPIYGFWTIKRNGKVVWTQDPDASVDDKAYAAKWAQKATFYFGTETQMPDSTIESYKGAGKVSAHRGIAYIVVEDDDVTDNGGAVPTYEAICIGIGTSYATSPPYIAEMFDVNSYTIAPIGGRLKRFLIEQPYEESESFAIEPLGGRLRQPLQTYDNYSDSEQFAVTPIGGRLRMPLITYPNYKDAESFAISPQGGRLKQTLITYDSFDDAESFAIQPLGGRLA